jgi:hypothetical protein
MSFQNFSKKKKRKEKRKKEREKENISKWELVPSN